jgi:hypothetical protein
MKLKHLLLGAAAALLIASAAMAQVLLYPNLRGTYSEHQADIGFFGMIRLNANLGLTATPSGTLLNSQVLNLGFSQFTTIATGGDSATLPTLTGAVQIVVVNGTSATSMNIWPNAAASTINALPAGTAFALAGGKSVMFYQTSAGVWITIPTVP